MNKEYYCPHCGRVTRKIYCHWCNIKTEPLVDEDDFEFHQSQIEFHKPKKGRKHLIFVYGMFLQKDRFNYLGNNDYMKPYAPAVLPMHRLRFRCHASVEPDITSQVKGALYEVSDTALRKMDGMEGVPYYYTREKVWVNVGNNGNGKSIQVFVYKMNLKSLTRERPVNLPSEGYLRGILDGLEQWGWGFDCRKQVWEALEECPAERKQRWNLLRLAHEKEVEFQYITDDHKIVKRILKLSLYNRRNK